MTPDQTVSLKNLKFLVNEVFRAEELAEYEYFADHDRAGFDLMLETAVRLTRETFLPILTEMDRNQPEFEDGVVKVHPSVPDIMKACGEGGWIAAGFPYEYGGQQLPITVKSACMFTFSAANYSAAAYPFLTSGAARLLMNFGSPELIETYLAPLTEGRWQGTMALTEPQAGSSLGDIRTTAYPAEDGSYRIKGRKIFISAGDHDGVDNVVHMALAKIKGAPAGAKGISLFLIPKKRLDGGELVGNDVTTMGIYHKLGYRGAPITELAFGDEDDCHGYLLGEPHKGLRYMFQMMNEARIDVGLSAAAIASAGYYASLSYAMERPQGRPLGGKDPNSPQVPLVEHSDVKRMLLFQRSIVEGSLGLIIQCSKYADLEHVAPEGEREKYGLLLEILTPVAKSYPSEMGILSVSQGLQVLGGYGYCDEFVLEQLYRDARIHPIHEGTTGIQGLDLLGRKVSMKDGAAYKLFREELDEVVKSAHEVQALAPYAERLAQNARLLDGVTDHLRDAAASEPARGLADATLYLELFGIIAIGWQWLLQGMAAQKGLADAAGPQRTFYEGKLATMKYFFHYELPKSAGLAARLEECDGMTSMLDQAIFED
jgi:butyryl-CoA dehydrogenase